MGNSRLGCCDAARSSEVEAPAVVEEPEEPAGWSEEDTAAIQALLAAPWAEDARPTPSMGRPYTFECEETKELLHSIRQARSSAARPPKTPRRGAGPNQGSIL